MPDAESPAEPLDHMALNLPRDEFLARMLLWESGVRRKSGWPTR